MRRMFGLMALPALLAACDAVVIDDASQDYLDAYDAHTAQVARVAAMTPATSAQVPTLGSLTYQGTAGLAMDTRPGTSTTSDTSIIGDVVMTANFGADDMTGRIDNFVGIIDGDPATHLNGFLTISDGDLRVLTSSQFGAQLDGTLFTGSDVIGVDGSIIGNLRSQPFRNVSGLSAITAGGTDFTLNGVEHPGLMSIVAER